MKQLATMMLTTLAVALFVTGCVGSDPGVTTPGGGLDGGSTDGATTSDAGTDCTPCVLGTAALGNCCVR